MVGISIVILIPGVAGDSTHESGQEGKCGDCQEADQTWSQREPHQQGESSFDSKYDTRVWQEDWHIHAVTSCPLSG